MIARSSLIVLLVIGITFPLAAQKRPKPPTKPYKGIQWVASLEEGLKEGKGRGCALLICITNQSGHDNTTKVILAESAVVKLSKNLVCVVAHNDYAHTPKPRKGEKRYDGPCPLYGTIKCGHHVAVWSKISARFIRHSSVQNMDVPQHIYVDPTLDEELFRRLGGLDRKDMVYDMTRAIKAVGKGISAKAYRGMRNTLDKASTLIDKGQYSGAADLLADFAKFEKKYKKKKTGLVPEGLELIKELQTKGRGLIRDALDFEKNGQFDKAKHTLERVSREFKPFPIAREGRTALTDLRKRIAARNKG